MNQNPQPPKNDGLGIFSVFSAFLGIFSIICGFIPVVCFVALGAAVLAIIGGIVGRMKNYNPASVKIATIGLVLGVVGLVFSLLGIVCTVVCAAVCAAA